VIHVHVFKFPLFSRNSSFFPIIHPTQISLQHLTFQHANINPLRHIQPQQRQDRRHTHNPLPRLQIPRARTSSSPAIRSSSFTFPPLVFIAYSHTRSQDAGIAYTDIRYSSDEYPHYKQTKIAELNPAATIPVIELNGRILTQSYAILRHMSRLLGGVYDGETEEEVYFTDVICDMVIDWRTL
jgi:hypothetical protein